MASRVASCALAFCLLVGCGGERLEPVEGKITVNGRPLATGTMILKPDTAKGNTGTAEPAGLIENGTFKVYTTQRPGAPAGWYKVIVVAVEPMDPKDLYAERPTLIDTKYNALATTDQVIEVRTDAPADAYDLKLTK